MKYLKIILLSCSLFLFQTVICFSVIKSINFTKSQKFDMLTCIYDFKTWNACTNVYWYNFLFLFVVRITIKMMVNIKTNVINWTALINIRNVTRVYKIGTRFDLNPSIISIQLFNLWAFKTRRGSHGIEKLNITSSAA